MTLTCREPASLRLCLDRRGHRGRAPIDSTTEVLDVDPARAAGRAHVSTPIGARVLAPAHGAPIATPIGATDPASRDPASPDPAPRPRDPRPRQPPPPHPRPRRPPPPAPPPPPPPPPAPPPR